MLVAPTPGERGRATRVVRRHARDDHDEAELLAMLGLDRAEPAQPEPKPHGALTPSEVQGLLAPFAAGRLHRPPVSRPFPRCFPPDAGEKHRG